MSDETDAVEKKLISRLNRLGRDWPEGYWLFSANGNLNLMREPESGDRVLPDGGGVDPELVVCSIHGIPNDGGDW